MPGLRWLFKPGQRSGGVGCREVAGGSWLTPTASTAPTPNLPGSDWVAGTLQLHQPGWPLGVSFLARQRLGQHQVCCLGAAVGRSYRQHPTDRWLYGGSSGPLSLSPQQHSRLLSLGQTIATQFDLVGLFNVDLIVPPRPRRDGLRQDGNCDEWVLLEINPRYSASMELLPTAGRLIDAHLAAYQERWRQLSTAQADQRLQPLFQASEAMAPQASEAVIPQASGGCKRVVYAPRPLRYNLSHDHLRQLQRSCDDRFSIEFCDLPQPDSEITTHCPLLTIIVRQANTVRQGNTGRHNNAARQANVARQGNAALQDSAAANATHPDVCSANGHIDRSQVRDSMQVARRVEATLLSLFD